MTLSGLPDTAANGTPAERDIIEFLRAHPSFLDQHPELLAQLSIPHASGNAVSLIERQLIVLREENARLKSQLDRLVVTARQNDSLNGRIHTLVLALMNAVGPRAIFDNLENCLREDFRADHVATRIFADPGFVDGASVPQFVGLDGDLRALFANVIDGGVSVCGVLAAAERVGLFGDEIGKVSAVTMPLIGAHWAGVLVIASNDAERYQADMGTEFLTYLKDVVTLVIGPWVKNAKGL